MSEHQETEADLRALVNAIRRSEAIIRFTPEGTILNANDNFLKALGYTLEEVRGRHHRMFCDPDTAASSAYAALWQSLQAGEFVAGEFRRISKSGDDVWIRASYNPVFGTDGSVETVVKIARSITASKRVSLGVAQALRGLAETDFEEVARNAMLRIEESSRKISNIAELINEISRRTQLLGLNAEIEASQAGEHGRGFSVVAREIRKLAIQSEESVDQIRKLTNDASATIAASGREIGKCTEDIKRTVELVTTTQKALADVETASNANRRAAEQALEAALRQVNGPTSKAA